MKNIARFRAFIQAFTHLIEEAGDDEPRIFKDGSKLLADLVNHDDWLPDEFAQSRPERYQQYLLYCDPLERFSVVSFVWGPGQDTPVHDHTVWGMVGMMRGAESCEEFTRALDNEELVASEVHPLKPGEVDLVSPRVGDIHRVGNALKDRPSISIHVYGGNIGAVRRHIYNPETGATKPFISGYSNTTIPNIWDRSAEAAAAS
jgi:predicted metal-dependent enzyme (double-stranded beta helix superfamily)